MAYSQSNEKIKIVICGGGLVGCLAACFFAKRNYTVTLYELRSDIRTIPVTVGRSYGLGLSTRGSNALSKLQMHDEGIISKGIKMPSRLLHDVNGNIREVPYSKKGHYWLSINRRFMNVMLLDEVEKYKNIQVLYGHKIINCNTKTGDLVFRKVQTGELVNDKCDLIVGCDGLYSMVRQCLLKDEPITFSQTYISSWYMEFHIPAKKRNNGQVEFPMPAEHMHIWPRGHFMMIALPNPDCSFTCNIFMPREMFEKIKTESDLLEFFDKYFADIRDMIGKDKLAESFFTNKPVPLCTIKTSQHHGKKCILLGDSAHGQLPFYGQGMNTGFEDLVYFFDLLDQKGFEHLSEVLSEYSNLRVPDAHAICELSEYNFKEMRILVTTKAYKLRKYLDTLLYSVFPTLWIPLYTMVAFTNMRFSKVVAAKKLQDQVIKYTSLFLVFLTVLLILFK